MHLSPPAKRKKKNTQTPARTQRFIQYKSLPDLILRERGHGDQPSMNLHTAKFAPPYMAPFRSQIFPSRFLLQYIKTKQENRKWKTSNSGKEKQIIRMAESDHRRGIASSPYISADACTRQPSRLPLPPANPVHNEPVLVQLVSPNSLFSKKKKKKKKRKKCKRKRSLIMLSSPNALQKTSYPSPRTPSLAPAKVLRRHVAELDLPHLVGIGRGFGRHHGRVPPVVFCVVRIVPGRHGWLRSGRLADVPICNV